jgi:lipopolysaccharide transport system ATP-binding protein
MNWTDSKPTIFHITQYKAGSQWILKILLKCAGDRIVQPKLWAAQFLKDPIVSGAVYPAVYVTKRMFERTRKPENSKHFVILRDLRDTAVSGYFSLKLSHPLMGPAEKIRRKLNSRDLEEGMLWILKNWLPINAKICSSWVKSNEAWIRYEDLLLNDSAILEEIFLKRCLLGVDAAALREAVNSCRFESLSQGRKRGEEDVSSHWRKGVAGDWRNYFTPKIKKIFKRRYGELLIMSGYEKNDQW